MRPVRNPERLAAFVAARDAVARAEASRSDEDVLAAWRAMAVLGVHPTQVWLVRRAYKAARPGWHGWRDASRQLLTDLLPMARRFCEGPQGDRIRRAVNGPRPPEPPP